MKKKLFRKIVSDPLLKNVENALSFEAKILYYKIHIIYSEAESDDKKSFMYADQLVTFMELHKKLINDFIKEYVFALVQKLTSAFNMGEYEKALSISKDMRNKKIRSIEQKEYIFHSTNLIELFIYIVDCEFEEGLKIIPQIENELKNISSEEIKCGKINIIQKHILYIFCTRRLQLFTYLAK